jgi:hypothetical protein
MNGQRQQFVSTAQIAKALRVVRLTVIRAVNDGRLEPDGELHSPGKCQYLWQESRFAEIKRVFAHDQRAKQ